MGAFDFLGGDWGLDLASEEAKENLEWNVGENLSRRAIEQYIKDSDLRKLGAESRLPKEITRIPNGELPKGCYMVQVMKTSDITQPSKIAEEFESGKNWRLLKINFTDGTQKFDGIELSPIESLSIQNPPGTKVLLWSGSPGIKIQNGHLLLTKDVVQVLGGEVEKLIEGWRMSKEAEDSRVLWRTGQSKKRQDGDGGPPIWEDFNPKKPTVASLPRGQGDRAGGRAEEKEKLAKQQEKWQEEAKKNPQQGGASADQAWAEAKNNVTADKPSSQAMAKLKVQEEEGKGYGKGKGDKGKSKGERRKREEDYDDVSGGARPAQMTSLAAFIKPTKDGALPDAAVKALAGEEEWDDDDWDEGWGESAEGWGGGWSSGGGGGGWSSGGWSGGGGGKGGGKRKGGGKGGGKKKGKGGGKGRGW